MLPLPPLLPITSVRGPGPLSGQLHRFGDAGFPVVQFRGKPLGAADQWAELQRGLQASREAGGWPLIILNDRADLAVLAAREGLTPWGLHLGQEDLPLEAARRLPGLGGLRFGTSTHHPGEWERATECDYAGVGPVRGTPTKPDHATPIGIAGLRLGSQALRSRGISPVAIGGLGPEDAGPCFEAGAESLAMVSALAEAGDPSEILWESQVLRWRRFPPFRRGQGIVLAGSSGAGKSSLGVELARTLALPFLDLDQLIVLRSGKGIPRIFAEQGEAAFRALEERLAQEAVEKPCVLALGGGAWESPGLRARVASSGFSTLWLAETPMRCWARVAEDPGRPLAREREIFLDRHRARILQWSLLPCILPLGRSPGELAGALAAALD
ncbi:MAG: thiamine phosphate synthase [Acidobacteria bacterium]|nr:thiamine phosphate synthase [Acidobacteriota bacterium]